MTRQNLQAIDILFHPNYAKGRLLNPISVRKLKKGYGQWITTKTVIGWAIGMSKQVLTLP